MHFSNYLIKGIRLLLFPFSLVVGLIVSIKNALYNKKLLRSVSFNLPIIGVGNLSVGGTGKSPMTEWIIEVLSPQYAIATLSRGYKRKTKGYLLANADTTALEIGDEPMQFFMKYPQLAVAVGEQRIEAIPQLLHDRPQTQVIILDDAFQHRQLNAGLNILLTEYGNPYWHDWYLPTGDLRDNRKSAHRAQIIVVTKCPLFLTIKEKNSLLNAIGPLPHQQVFFAGFEYGDPYHIITHETRPMRPQSEVLLVCGIANPIPLKQHIEQIVKSYQELSFADHHIFSIDDLRKIESAFNQIDEPDKMIITTQKDAVRLAKFGDALKNLPLYVQPVKHRILFDEHTLLASSILKFVENFSIQNQ